MSDIFSYAGSGSLLTSRQMAFEESRAFSSGISEFDLMSHAGMGCADFIYSHFGSCFKDSCRVLILCGPGNNGGDGFVIARHLSERGWDICVGLVGVGHISEAAQREGIAGKMLDLWLETGGRVICFSDYKDISLDISLDISFSDYHLLIDAVFGTGLSRSIGSLFYGLIEAMNGVSCPIISIDIPSGVCSDSGAVLGIGVRASMTLALHRRKLGHILFPGNDYCGSVHIIDIGVPPPATGVEGGGYCYENGPYLWRNFFPHFSSSCHKYDRGHILSLSGPSMMTGASRLAAVSALRIGSGLVTVGCFDRESALIHGCHLTSIMICILGDVESLISFIVSRKVRSVILGPGFGVGLQTYSFIEGLLKESSTHIVLDADALTVLGEDRDYFASLIHSRPASWGGVVLTPHMGEAGRLCGDKNFSSKCDYALFLAQYFSSFVVLKGGDSVIACPDGRLVLNNHALSYLATAGSGDVLAGIIGGLSGMGMDIFYGCCCGVWVHAEAGRLAGYGFIAEDLPCFLSSVLIKNNIV